MIGPFAFQIAGYLCIVGRGEAVGRWLGLTTAPAGLSGHRGR